ncbi:hypothetical protein S245_012503, partial [Arachis hypogaea]
ASGCQEKCSSSDSTVKGKQEIGDPFSSSKSDSPSYHLVKAIPLPPPITQPPPGIVPLVRLFTEPSFRKRKTPYSEFGSAYDPDFDAIAFCEEYILFYSAINMDDVSLKKHLQVLARGEIQITRVCLTFLKQFNETLLGATQRELADLRSKVASLRETKSELEAKK